MLDGDISPAQDLTALVPWADWVVFSEAGLIHAYGVGGEAGLDLALKADAHGRAPLAVAQTLGSQGVCWKRAGQPLQHQPAWPVGPVVDTLGAGDVFHAALGLALWEGMGDATAMGWASAAAALKCLQPQGILGAPTRAAVMAFLAQAGAPFSG
jgi:sulfofructose kinase